MGRWDTARDGRDARELRGMGGWRGGEDEDEDEVVGWRDGGMGAGHSGMRLVERFGVGKLGTTNGTKGTNGGAA